MNKELAKIQYYFDKDGCYLRHLNIGKEILFLCVTLTAAIFSLISMPNDDSFLVFIVVMMFFLCLGIDALIEDTRPFTEAIKRINIYPAKSEQDKASYDQFINDLKRYPEGVAIHGWLTRQKKQEYVLENQNYLSI
ncbi:hypothetical protein [Rosenbergiella collisarenosi]|uniref:hypothetical protein n=1 Tax=Rosenbergiella collisarenosi TaxID=1544695 RepID=UPI001F4E2EEE|nr:hypothetical protein [Rosenbergiella collisarenosi]